MWRYDTVVYVCTILFILVLDNAIAVMLHCSGIVDASQVTVISDRTAHPHSFHLASQPGHVEKVYAQLQLPTRRITNCISSHNYSDV